MPPPLIRIIPHPESVEVRVSTFIYFDDDPGRRSVTGRLTRQQAEDAAKTLARAKRPRAEDAAPQRSPAETIDQSYDRAMLVISDYLEHRIDTKAAIDRLISVLDDDELREAITEILVDAKVHPRPS